MGHYELAEGPSELVFGICSPIFDRLDDSANVGIITVEVRHEVASSHELNVAVRRLYLVERLLLQLWGTEAVLGIDHEGDRRPDLVKLHQRRDSVIAEPLFQR